MERHQPMARAALPETGDCAKCNRCCTLQVHDVQPDVMGKTDKLWELHLASVRPR